MEESEEIQEDITAVEAEEEIGDNEADITSEEKPEEPTEPQVDKFAELEAKIKAEYDTKIKTLEERNSNLMSMFNQEQDKVKKMQEQPSYYNPEWQPETYEDLGNAIKTAEERGKEAALEAIRQQEEAREATKNSLDSFMAKAKEDFKEFDQVEFAQFIREHKLPVQQIENLEPALSVFKAYKQAELKVKTTVEKVKRQDDGVSGGAAREAGKPLFTGQDIRRMDMRDLVSEALNKLK